MNHKIIIQSAQVISYKRNLGIRGDAPFYRPKNIHSCQHSFTIMIADSSRPRINVK